MTVFGITQAAMRRIVRDRTALFFMVALPIVIIIVVGAVSTGGTHFRVGVLVHDRRGLAHELVTALERGHAIDVTEVRSESGARDAVRRQELDALVIVPAGTDTRLRTGETVTIPVYGTQVPSNAQAVRAAVSSALASVGAVVRAAHFAADTTHVAFSIALRSAHTLATATPKITIGTTVVDQRRRTLPQGFSYSAPTMLVLFVFVNSLASGAAIIETRSLGVYDRAMASPAGSRSIVLGEASVYAAIAIMQSLLIIGVGGFVFGVDWGDPLAAAALTVVWAAVGTGAGLLAGTVFRTPEQSSSIAPAVGMTMGMLGGCMWPLEIVPPAMRTLGHLTPQAWAIDAWTAIMSRGSGITGITRELAVLGGFAVVLLAVSVMRLRRSLTA